MDLQELLSRTITLGASDLHLMAGCRPAARVNGELQPLEGPALAEADVRALLAEMRPDFKATGWADDPMANAHFGCVGPGGARFRVFAQKHAGGSAIVMRLLPCKVPAPDALGMPQSLVERICTAPRGLVVITGESGSGKSTTLYSLIGHINATRGAHIVFICDFPDYDMEPRKSLIRTIEVGTHVPSYADAARACIRIDPDVVVFAEWRDLETIGVALALVEMGHLVFTLLHCNSAAEALARIVDVFPTQQQAGVARRLAAGIQCVIAQRLLPKAAGKGRVAAQEVLLGTPAVRELISEQRFREIPGALAEGERDGMWTMSQHLRRLADAGVVRSEA